jgi:hypothetical protein
MKLSVANLEERRNHLVKDYFDDFIAAFSTFNGERVATKFIVPYLAQGASGERTLFTTVSELGEYFQQYLDEYQRKGIVQCRYANLEVKWLGTESAVASVTWSLLDAAGSLIMSWSESYVLAITKEQALAFASVDHSPD